MIRSRRAIVSALAVTISREGTLHFTGIDQTDWGHLDADGGRDGLNCSPLANAGRDGGVAQNRSAGRIGGDFLEQREPFCGYAVIKLGKTGDIATWSGQTRQARGRLTRRRPGASARRKLRRKGRPHLKCKKLLSCQWSFRAVADQ